jgi:hypothetical protein
MSGLPASVTSSVALCFSGKSYSAPTGALECVAPTGGPTWATAQQDGAAQFALFFSGLGLAVLNGFQFCLSGFL